MKTILQSTDAWFRIAARDGKFYLCRFNESSGKYRPLHKFGTFYHVAINLDRSICWDYGDCDPVPEQLSFYPLFEDPILAGLWN